MVASYWNWIRAGWANIGLRDALRRWAIECDVDYSDEKSWSLVDRTIYFKVTGEAENVRRFKEGLFRFGQAHYS